MSILRRDLLLSLALGGAAIIAQAPAQARRAGTIQPEAWQIVVLANQARAGSGAAPLQWDEALAAAARQHCLRMAAEGPISHQYAGEPDVSARANQAGARFSLIEENVAIGPTPEAIHNEWMHSPRHRENLLNPDVDRVGVALVASRGVLYAVADYERAVPLRSQAQVEAAVAAQLQAKGLTVLRDATIARAACTMDRGFPDAKSGPQPRFVMRWQDAEMSRLPDSLVNRLATGDYRSASVGSCPPQGQQGAFTAYRVAVLLY
jgi:hypothetical protein